MIIQYLKTIIKWLSYNTHEWVGASPEVLKKTENEIFYVTLFKL